MKKYLIIVFISFTTLFAQDAGKTGMSFLKLGSGAKNIALADAGTVFANDITTLFYNPAKLALSERSELYIMHNEWIQDVRSEQAALSFSLFSMNFAIGFNGTTVTGIEVRTKPGPVVADVNANYLMVKLGTGFALSNKLYAGVNANYYYEGIIESEAYGYGVDFGLLYKVMDNVQVSAALRNLGSMNNLNYNATALPTDFRVGTLYSIAIPDAKLIVEPGVEYQQYLDAGSHVNAGANILYDSLIALRIGYSSGFESRSITTGLGIEYKSLSFDYALTPFSYSLGSGHSISLKVKL